MKHAYPWPRDGLHRFLRTHLLHGIIVLFLIICHEHLKGPTSFLLLFIEIIDDNSDKQIQSEK